MDSSKSDADVASNGVPEAQCLSFSSQPLLRLVKLSLSLVALNFFQVMASCFSSVLGDRVRDIPGPRENEFTTHLSTLTLSAVFCLLLPLVAVLVMSGVPKAGPVFWIAVISVCPLLLHLPFLAFTSFTSSSNSLSTSDSPSDFPSDSGLFSSLYSLPLPSDSRSLGPGNVCQRLSDSELDL